MDSITFTSPELFVLKIFILCSMRMNRLISIIMGDDKDAPLEYRLFLSVTVVGMIVGLLGTIVSIALSSEFTVIIVALSSFLLLAVLYYFVRVKKIYKPFVGPIIVFAFIVISIVWITDGGINGSNLFVGFVILILALIIVPDQNTKYVISLFLALTITIYLIQLYRPDLITDFSSERARWIDSIITALYSSVFIYFIIKFLHNSYNTERKRAKENELKFRALSENSQDCITRYDREHRFTYINRAGLELRGLSHEQIIGKTHGETGIFNKSLCELFARTIEKVFTSKQPQNEQYSMENQGDIVYYDWRLFPELNINNEVGSVLGVSRDITELKQSEIELLQLNMDKDRFISILGHDLKSPLISLLSLSDVLVENIQNYETDEIEPILVEIKQSTRITYDLLEDLLSWAKAQSGKISFNPQKLLFSDICENVVEILGPNAKAKSIKINLPATDPQIIVADVEMLRTIMRNLLSNAIKFTSKGGEINIQAKDDSAMVKILVSDNGVGIAPDNLAKLFSISSIHSTRGTEKEKGTGLGLLLCKEFVENHRGKIWAESEEGKGSTFIFTLPKIIE